MDTPKKPDLIECEIILDDQQSKSKSKMYSPGHCISGRVFIYSKHQLFIKDPKMIFTGIGHVHYPEERKLNRFFGSDFLSRIPVPIVDQTNNWNNLLAKAAGCLEPQAPPLFKNTDEVLSAGTTEEEEYLNHNEQLVGYLQKKRTDGKFEYRFSFDFRVPRGLPSSYKGIWGHIVYKMRPHFTLPWGYKCETAKEFLINGIVDLNRHPHARRKLSLNESKLSSGLYGSGDIGFQFMIERKGIVIGQKVRFEMKIHNKSTHKVTGTVCLIQAVEYYGGKVARRVVKQLSSDKSQMVLPGQDFLWQSHLQVPGDIPPTEFGGGSHLFDVQYYIKVRISKALWQGWVLERLARVIVCNIGYIEPEPEALPLVEYSSHSKVSSSADARATTSANKGANVSPMDQSLLMDYSIIKSVEN